MNYFLVGCPCMEGKTTQAAYSSYFLVYKLLFGFENASMDKPKPRFASSISQSVNHFFIIFIFCLKKYWRRALNGRSKVALPFSLICSVDFFMLSPQIWSDFLALIPPSFTSLNPFVTCFRPLQTHSSSHKRRKYENSRVNSDASRYM